jgi:hypothetical protein
MSSPSIGIPTKINRTRNQKDSLSDFNNSDTSSDCYQDFIDFPNNKIEIFKTIKIRKKKEKKINEEAGFIKDKNLSFFEKKLIVLNKKNSSSEVDDDNNINNRDRNNDSLSSYGDASTNYTNCSSYTNDPLDKKKEYWIRYKLYDNKTKYDIKNKKVKIPKLKELDLDKIYYLYSNSYTTYYFTKSAYLGDNQQINENETDSDECKLNESLGLFFCGKNIEYNNEKTVCSPNKMICERCMKKNKKRYNLNEKYLININGRVAIKIKDGNKGFHCFGHFSIGKIQIENCLKKFSCKACSLLDKYEQYYLFSK